MNHQRTVYTWNDKLPMRRTLPYDVVFVFGSNLFSIKEPYG